MSFSRTCRAYCDDAQYRITYLHYSYSSLIFAGTDTTSSALTQTLHTLAEHPAAQDRLRSEIQSAVQRDDISYDELNALPFLDAVCRETLRL